MQRVEDMTKHLPPMTTMMLDALVGSLPQLPKNNRIATVCRCVYQVYSMTHGTRAPWDVMGEPLETTAKRVETQPITIIDTTGETVEETDRPISNRRNRRRTRVGAP